MESRIESDREEGNSSGKNEGAACSDQEESGEDKGKHYSVHFFLWQKFCYLCLYYVLDNAFLGGSLTISHKYSISLSKLLPFACCFCSCHMYHG